MAAAALVVAVPVWFLFIHNREPRYEGQPVSYWFRQYCYRDQHFAYQHENELTARKALLTIGTNALPYLLKVALDTNDDSAIRKGFKNFLDGLPDEWHVPRLVSRKMMQDSAEFIILEMHPPAEAVLPLLQNELNQPNMPAYSEVIYILSITTNGTQLVLPYFRKALHVSDKETQFHALEGISRLGTEAAGAVPDLMEIIQTSSRNNPVVFESENVLGMMGSNAYPALPLLKNLFGQETNIYNRFNLATALCMIDSQQTEAFNFLTSNLTNWDNESLIRSTAWRLSLLGPAAQPAIPTLVTALSATNAETWDRVLKTLVVLHARPELYMPIIKEKLKTGDEESRMQAAVFILNKEHTNQESQLFLMDQIRNENTNETDAITALGAVGPAASSAIPVILGALDGTNFESWSEIPSALTNIGAPVQLFLAKFEEKIKPDRNWNAEDHPELFDVAETILEYDSANHDAQLALLRFPQNLRSFVVLSDANPAIPEVKTALRKASKSNKPDVRRAAANALEIIEAREKMK